MPTRQKLDRWKVIAGYVGFSVAVFVLLLYLTFPYEALGKRLSNEASSQGLSLTFSGLGAGFFGLSASSMQISKRLEAGEDSSAEPVVVRSVKIRPSLIPLGLAFGGNVFGGRVRGSMGGSSDVSIRVQLDGLNAADERLRTLSGLDLAGRARGRLSLDIPKAPPTPLAKTRDPDLSQAKGSLLLNVDQLTVNGGTLKIPIDGEMTPVDLPRIAIGDVEAKINFQKGLGTIEKFQAKGSDVDLLATGTVKLSKRLEYSEPNVDVRMKLEPDFTRRLGIMAMGLSTLPEDKQNPGYRLAKLTGFLGKPAFGPGRQ